jgi:hypothetical protein
MVLVILRRIPQKYGRIAHHVLWSSKILLIVIDRDISMSRYTIFVTWFVIRDGHVKLVKCADIQNVSDTLTKRLSRPTFEKHREHMWGTRVPFSTFFSPVGTPTSPCRGPSCQSLFLLLTTLGKPSVKVVKVSLSTPIRGEWNNVE